MNWTLSPFLSRALDTVEYYNADTDSWSYAANMTEPKLGVACIGYKGHLYVMGGSIDRGGKKVVLKTVECYDPKLNWYECSVHFSSVDFLVICRVLSKSLFKTASHNHNLNAFFYEHI